jgi:hypothetical protein
MLLLEEERMEEPPWNRDDRWRKRGGLAAWRPL